MCLCLPPAGGQEEAQGKIESSPGKLELEEFRANGFGSGPRRMAGVLLRHLQARPAQREAGEQVLVCCSSVFSVTVAKYSSN
jgi:hypothetical protein